MPNNKKQETFGLLQPAKENEQGHAQDDFGDHDRGQEQGIDHVFARKIVTDKGHGRRYRNSCADHTRNKAKDKRSLKGRNNRLILGKPYEPPDADALHGEARKLRSIKCENDDDHDRCEHGDVDKEGVETY